MIFLVIFSPNFSGTNFNNSWVLVICGLTLVSFFFFSDKTLPKSTIIFLVFFFFLFVLQIIHYLGGEHGGAVEVLRLITFFFIIVNFSKFSNGSQYEEIIKVGTVFIVISFLIYILINFFPKAEDLIFKLYYINQEEGSIGYMRTRISLTIGNPNALAFCLILFLVYFFWYDNHNFISHAVTFIGVYLVFMTYSRTGILVLLFLLVSLVITRVRIKLIIYTLILIIPAIILAAYYGFFDSVLARMQDFSGFGGREDLWYELIISNNFKDAFHFGLGVIPGNAFVDNDFFVLYIKYGWLGLALYILLLVFSYIVILKKIFRRKSQYAICSFWLLTVIVLFSVTSSPLTSFKMGILFYMLFIFSFSKST